MGERELALSELKKSATGTESPGATHRSLRDTDEGRDKSASITASIEQINRPKQQSETMAKHSRQKFYGSA